MLPVWLIFSSGMSTSSMVYLTLLFQKGTHVLGHFWRTLWKKVGTSEDYSTTFHPQTDWQTEVVNKSLSNILRCLVGDHPKEWEGILPVAEFAFNISINRSPSFSPFKIVYGSNPTNVTDLVALPILQRVHRKAKNMTEVMQPVHQQIKAKLEATNAKYKSAIVLHRKLISKDRRPEGQYAKLRQRKHGPCRVWKRINHNSYEIELSSHMSISNIFNVLPYSLPWSNGGQVLSKKGNLM